jgi:uncharacterized SAM-binding protein YcdF (DUF218 family)
MKRYLTLKNSVIVVMVGAVIWALVIVVLAVLIYTTGEENNTQPADVIVVLGSGLRRDGRPGDALYRRSVWASRLYAQGIAPTVICTGGIGDRQRRSEASACAEVLRANGVPAAVILLEERSRSTEENAIYTRQIMEDAGFADAALVTDSFHMLRASWIFGTYDVTHYASPVPRDWVRTRFYVRHFSREILALHWQAFKEVFNIKLTNVG